MEEIQYENHEVRNAVLKLIAVIAAALVLTYCLFAYENANYHNEKQLVGNKYYTEDLTLIFEFKNEKSGLLLKYEYDKQDKKVISSSSRHQFDYALNEESNTIDLVVDNYDPSELVLRFIKNGLIDCTQNKYYYLYTE